MKLRDGIISAIAGASLLGGVGVAALVATGGSAAGPADSATLTAASSTASPAAASTSSPTSSGTSSTSTSTCAITADDESWPAYVQGEPAGFAAGDAAGVYLWHDQTGWHLRVTHQNDHHQTYTGRLETSGTFTDVDAVKLEGNDHMVVGPDKHVIDFRFNNYGGVDGIDFRTHCAPAIRFDLRADGAKLNPTEVYIGHASANPPGVPFDIDRTA